MCGYSTGSIPNWCRHKKTCRMLKTDKDEMITQMREQLAAKDAQFKEQMAAKDAQLAAKDEQIRELIQVAKKPRTTHTTHTTTNRYVVEQHVNIFGRESTEHISAEQIQTLLADPSTAVSQFIRLKHRRAPGGINQNVRVPNQKRAIYQVVVTGDEGEKEWESKAKGEVLEELYDVNSGHLEAEADEETTVGSRFLDFHDRVKESASGKDGGRRYKEQLDKIHCAIAA